MVKGRLDWERASKEGLARRHGSTSFSENEIDKKPGNKWHPYSSAASVRSRPKGALQQWIEDYQEGKSSSANKKNKTARKALPSTAKPLKAKSKKRKKLLPNPDTEEARQARREARIRKIEQRMEKDPEYAEKMKEKRERVAEQQAKRHSFVVETKGRRKI